MYKRQLYTKGAIDVLLDRSQYVLTATGPEPLTAEKRQPILDVNLAPVSYTHLQVQHKCWTIFSRNLGGISY